METGTVTGAASRLHRTQPQVSRLIGNLEEELGFKLFARHKRRLTPTQEGRVFYREVEQILSGFDGISSVIHDLRNTNEPRLRIVAQSFMCQSLIPTALADFIKREPRLRYALDVGSRADIQRWFEGQHVDMGFAALPVGHELAIRSQPFARARVVAILPKDHRLARKQVVDAHDLAKEPFIGLKPYTLLRKEIDRLFSELGLHLNIRCEVSSGEAVCHLVSRGLGVSIEDPLLARGFESRGVVSREWRPSFELTYGFLMPVGQEPSSIVLQFAETVARTAVDLDPSHVSLLSDVGQVRPRPRRARTDRR